MDDKLADSFVCPSCKQRKSVVLDSRYRIRVAARVRRRECVECGHRWNTCEMDEQHFKRLVRVTGKLDKIVTFVNVTAKGR